VKAIETKWKGYRFRSRTEARWAVFLSALDVAFEYESEGVMLPSGPYLPDFRLRRFPGTPALGCQDVWLEIKGTGPTHEERFRCADLAVETGNIVLLAEGAPDYAEQVWLFDPRAEMPAYDAWLIDALSFCNDARTGQVSVGRGARDPMERVAYMEALPEEEREKFGRFHERCAPFDGEFLARLGVRLEQSRSDGAHMVGPTMRRAFDAARSARFEFGQVDPRWPS
jgi:hypothetical protein